MDISNKTLAMFLVAAVVISLGGTIISLNKLSKISTTGFATSTGTAQVQINSTASLRFSVSTIDFGSGSVNGSYNNCTLYSNVTGASWKSAGCIDFGPNMPIPFVIENDGNLGLNVTLNASKTAAQFIGAGTPSAEFQYLVANNETGSCVTSLIPGAVWTTVNTTGPGTLICQDFDYPDTNDTLAIGVRILIPVNAPTGAKSAIFTAIGTNP